MKGRVEADTDEMLGWIRSARTYATELKFSESDFLEDAIRAVPLLRRDGNAVMWSHKSLAEYFCAQFIVTDAKVDQSKICESMAQSIQLPSYRNVLDLLYDMDIGLFGQHFIKPLVDLYQTELVRLTAIFPDVPPAEVELRAAVTFGQRLFPLSDPGLGVSKAAKIKIHGISDSAMKEWYGIDAPRHGEDQVFDTRLTLGLFYPNRDRRLLFFAHALHTVLAILISKKHPLVILRPMYPTKLQKGEILGTRAASGAPINETPGAIWNSNKNFGQTTAAIARAANGILNVDRISAVLRDIQLSAGSSSTTDSILLSLKQSQ